MFNGKIWNDYNESNIDKFNSYSNLSNINFQFHSNWIDMKVKLKKASLENKMEQAKDRYSVNIKFSDLSNSSLCCNMFDANLSLFELVSVA